MAVQQVRVALPESEQAQDEFVLNTLRTVYKGAFSYLRSNNRRELCEGFNVRGRDFDKLICSIKRLKRSGRIELSEDEVRATKRYSGFCQPACRRITLRVIPVTKTADHRYASFVS